MKGNIFNIQNYCISDGPGIRTVIFFKGCPLRCLWCENPEAIYPLPQISFKESMCIMCKKCQQACFHDAIDLKSIRRIDWSICDYCGACTEVCMAEALEMIGNRMSVEEIMFEIRKETSFYVRSGGGVTISGGEPTLQYDFLVKLLEALKNENYHVVMETSGVLQWNKLEPLTKLVDIFYLDIKGIDGELHKRNTGIENSIILANAKNLAEKNVKVVYRIPVVPGFNYCADEVLALDRFLMKVKATEIHLLPFHNFGEDKLKTIHSYQRYLKTESMKPADLEQIRSTLEHSNRKVIISGT